MELVKFTPFGRALGLRSHMDSILSDFFSPSVHCSSVAETAWNPTVDVYDREDAIVVKAEVPGVDKKDISVNIDDGVLSIKGDRKLENEVQEDRYYRRERISGRFERAFRLPEGTDYEKIAADFKDGVLTITVPKAENKKPRQITIH